MNNLFYVAIVFVVIAAIAAAGFIVIRYAVNITPPSTQYHVTCYQTGSVIFEDDLIYMAGAGWKNTDGQTVLLPQGGCVMVEK